MADLDRRDAQLILAAIRVLAHRLERSPRPDEVAELLALPEATIRIRAASLQDLGAVKLVESAFETHLEVGDHLRVEDLPEIREEALAGDLADFDRRKQAEAEKMARLFEDGTFEEKRREKLTQMDRDLRAFPKKPRNPFGDD
ncbi:MAG TPA: hypothetical protein PLL30_08290 [Candidatus Krumholzibacteria bacterium]|nr:hypothetical protein [Candidatus Krumholzibacteria bacterium]HPD71756.1 hypothetical protein [Candidatus Krumholzibacteria bacterium]HRY41311.1 hypothetical protein [Candidatus Krumholzibacteria bacterium]